MTAAIAALVPPIGVALLFWFVMRAVLRADRNERAAMGRLDRAEAQRRAEEQARERAEEQTAREDRRGEAEGED